jgi:hypothetical protein
MSIMPPIIREAGVFGPALVLLGIVVLGLTARAFWLNARYRSRTGEAGPGGGPSRPEDAILFWGAASAVLGFLGQCHGAYLALNAIIPAPEISPGVVAQGFVISFIPALFGLGILTFAGIAWISIRFLLPKRPAP